MQSSYKPAPDDAKAGMISDLQKTCFKLVRTEQFYGKRLTVSHLITHGKHKNRQVIIELITASEDWFQNIDIDCTK